MNPALKAAIEINVLWQRCLDGARVLPERCPTNEEIAAIIEKYLTENSHD